MEERGIEKNDIYQLVASCIAVKLAFLIAVAKSVVVLIRDNACRRCLILLRE